MDPYSWVHCRCDSSHFIFTITTITSSPLSFMNVDNKPTNDTDTTPASTASCQGNGEILYTVQHHCTRNEVAELLHASTRTVDRLLASGKLTKIKLSEGKQGAVRIPYRAVLNYLRGINKQGAPVTNRDTLN